MSGWSCNVKIKNYFIDGCILRLSFRHFKKWRLVAENGFVWPKIATAYCGSAAPVCCVRLKLLEFMALSVGFLAVLKGCFCLTEELSSSL